MVFDRLTSLSGLFWLVSRYGFYEGDVKQLRHF